MIKGELIEAFEPFHDDIKILADLGQDCNNLTIVRPIVGTVYHLPLNGSAEIWLELSPLTYEARSET